MNTVPTPPRIELERELGAGATGRVRLGRLVDAFDDLPAGTRVAVKELVGPGAPADAAEAIRREAAAGRAVRHPNLVRVLYGGEDERVPYLVMPFVPGETLAEVLVRGRPPEPQVRAIGQQLASALAAFHAAGWRHGDVKPENVRLDERGNAVLLDLGFARPAGGTGCDEPRPGSLLYLAPELARGAAHTPASDVFALGVVLHQLATGQHPFAPGDGERAAGEAWLAALSRGGEVLPSRIDPRLSPLFDALVQAMLQREPASRPSAEQVAAVLAQGEAGAWWRARIGFGSAERRAAGDLHRLPFLGRDAELERLTRLFAAVQSTGRGQIVWLEGEPGSGKSRLMSEFVARVRARPEPPLYLDGSCSPFLEDRPGHPIRQLLRRWLHLPRHLAPGPRETELLRELCAASTVDSLVHVLTPGDDLPPAVTEPVAHADWLLRLGRSTPLIVFLDDVTYAREETLDVLARVADEIERSRLFVVLGLRQGTPPAEPVALENLQARLAARGLSASLALGPLAHSDVLELVELLFKSSTPRLRMARVLHERSGGSPGALSEMLRTMEARGHVRARGRAAEGLELLVAPDDLPPPRSRALAIADRFRDLPAEERLWLQRLAVVGGHLERGFLLRVFPDATPAELDGALASFVAGGWLVPDGGRFRFAGPAQREVVLDRMPAEQRTRIHAAAARALAELSEDPGSVDFERAYHLRAAGDHAALLAFVEPLVRSSRGGHPSRTHTYAAWALEALEHLPDEPERAARRIDLLEAAADAADRLGQRERQRAWLDQLSALDLDAEENPLLAGRVYLQHGRYAANTGQYGLGRGLLRNAAMLFARAGATELECAATLRLAHVQGHVGELAEAQRLASRALSIAGGAALRARCHLALAVVAVVRDELEEAQRLVDRARQALRDRDDPTGGRGALAAAYLLRARIHRLTGRPRRAFAAIQRARRLAQQAGERRLEAEIGARFGRLLLDVDRPREAELELREALLSSQEIEYRRGQALAAVFLGTLLAERGDPEAPAMLARATSLSQQMGLKRIEALAKALRARVARQEGRTDDADELSAQALETFEHFGGELADRIVIVETRALLLAERGDRDAARGLRQALQRRLRRVNDRIQSPITRQRHRRASTALAASARSADGPVYPRVAMRDLPVDAP